MIRQRANLSDLDKQLSVMALRRPFSTTFLVLYILRHYSCDYQRPRANWAPARVIR